MVALKKVLKDRIASVSFLGCSNKVVQCMTAFSHTCGSCD